MGNGLIGGETLNSRSNSPRIAIQWALSKKCTKAPRTMHQNPNVPRVYPNLPHVLIGRARLWSSTLARQDDLIRASVPPIVIFALQRTAQ